MPLPPAQDGGGLRLRLGHLPPALLQLLEACLQLDPARRPTAAELEAHTYFADPESWMPQDYQQAQASAHTQAAGNAALLCAAPRRLTNLPPPQPAGL